MFVVVRAVDLSAAREYKGQIETKAEFEMIYTYVKISGLRIKILCHKLGLKIILEGVTNCYYIAVDIRCACLQSPCSCCVHTQMLLLCRTFNHVKMHATSRCVDPWS